MADFLGAWPKCPHGRKGRHTIMVVTPAKSSGMLTYSCSECGMMERVPADGHMVPLDDMDAEYIKARVWGLVQ